MLWTDMSSMKALLKADKWSLIGSAVCENKQLFETVPTLGELAWLLDIVSQEMTVYTAWPVRHSPPDQPTSIADISCRKTATSFAR